MTWNNADIKPSINDNLIYANKYIRKLVYDKGGFVREGFYDFKEDYWFCISINKQGSFFEVPLFVEKWCDIPSGKTNV